MKSGKVDFEIQAIRNYRVKVQLALEFDYSLGDLGCEENVMKICSENTVKSIALG